MAYQYLSIAFTVNLAYLSLHSSGMWSVTVSSVHVPSTDYFLSSLFLSWSLHCFSSLSPSLLCLPSIFLTPDYLPLHSLSYSLSLSPNLHIFSPSHTHPSVPRTPFLWSVLYHTWVDTAQHELHHASGPAVREKKWWDSQYSCYLCIT